MLPGIAGNQIIYNSDDSVGGVITGDMGIDREGNMTDAFEAGIKIKAKQTIFTEGARGSLTEQVKEKFNL